MLAVEGVVARLEQLAEELVIELLVGIGHRVHIGRGVDARHVVRRAVAVQQLAAGRRRLRACGWRIANPAAATEAVATLTGSVRLLIHSQIGCPSVALRVLVYCADS